MVPRAGIEPVRGVGTPLGPECRMRLFSGLLQTPYLWMLAADLWVS